MSSSPPTLWTIGHSTKPIEAFVELLNAHGIRQLVDIRTITRSRYNPQFNSEALATSLSKAGISYRHAGELGGLRKPKKYSINTGWRNNSFRGYADYMETHAFQEAIDRLTVDSAELTTVIMCAEAVPWRCHRSLIADALLNRDWKVRHIMSETKAEQHRMTSFARINEGILSYQAADTVLRLF